MINEIKEALEKATPGPWMVKGNEVWTVKTDSEGYHNSIVKKMPCKELDLQLIANTPTYIRYLLDELEKANKALDAKFIFWSNGQDEDSYAKQEKMLQLEQEHTAMKEALEWYASDHNWGSIEEYGAWVSDGGELARTAISALTKPCID